MKYTELLVGAGNSRDKRVRLGDTPAKFQNLITLDMTIGCKPSVVYNLEAIDLPFKTDSFDELHAYEVLEHMGKQGDWSFFFAQFDEFARILKNGGLLVATSPHPASPWLWGDPGHTRYMGLHVYTFLDRSEYARQVGKTAMTDYRPYFKSNWRCLWGKVEGESSVVILKNLKH